MKRLTTAVVAGLLSVSSAAIAAPQLERVRGTIEGAEGGAVTIKTDDGKTETVALSDPKFVYVVKSSLDQVKEGTFIGTATKGENPLTAIEVVIFPDSMRGTGEGHYAWDAINDQSEGGGSKVKSSMTNATVKSTSGGGSKVKSAMTNGTIAKSSDASGQKTITVSYDKEGSKTIVVPPQAPIVAFEPADKTILTKGGKIFVVAAKDGAKLEGKLVAVGKDGLTPPM